MALLRDSSDDLFALCGATADFLGIDIAFVEKDFWVVELLRSVVKPLELEPVNSKPCSARVMFKGGTSLSKAHDLIMRFSEDVDILVAIEGYGEGASDNRVLRPICERVQQDLRLSDDKITVREQTRGIKRNVEYEYPSPLLSSAVQHHVLLEMGVRGGTMPGTQLRKIQSYIADYIAAEGIDADYAELASFEVEVIAPVRTLAEKVALLHHAGHLAADGKTESLQKAGRHLYDVDQLLHSAEVVETLSVPGQTMAVLAADVDAVSQKYHWPFTPRPADGTRPGNDRKLVPASHGPRVG
jgi:hypothetical protein